MTDPAPETWLKNETACKLEKVIGVLDVLHAPAFENRWLNTSPGREYSAMLTQIETLLLRMWVRMCLEQWKALERDVLEWRSEQNSAAAGVLQCYTTVFEFLTDWGNRTEIRESGLNGCWEDYLFHKMTNEQHLLSRLVRTHVDEEETVLLAEHYLRQMQFLQRNAPHQLCSGFFTLLSPFTGESRFVPRFSRFPAPADSRDDELLSFRDQLFAQTRWEKNARSFLEFLQKRV